ncbi:MAG: TauD/TfdA family dioxygenase, partial [Stellaceae bacterium]
MPISIRPLHPVFAGEVAGIDCRKPLTSGEIDAVEAGMNEYAVLIFCDQNLTDEEQIAFTRHFGELENYNTPGHVRKREDQRLGPGIADFSNLDKHGNIMSDEDRVWFFKLGDRLWHSDSSFRPIPAKYSLLSARVLPSWGANTEFADMRAAYDALDNRTKAEIEDLVCEHSLIYSREAIGFAADAGGSRGLPAGAAAAGADSSGDRPQIIVPVLACRRNCRLDDPRGAYVPARPDRACDSARVYLFAPVVAPRPGDVGQQRDDA